MGTIPVVPTVIAGGLGQAADFNKQGAVVTFWGTPPRCYAYGASATVLTTSGTVYPIALDAEVYEVANNYDGGGDAQHHDNVTNNSRIVFRTPGKYEISGQITFTNNATGIRFASVRQNAAGNPASGTLLFQTTQSAVAGGFATAVPITTFEGQFSAGDYIEAFGQQTSGGTLNTSTGQGVTFLRIKLAGS